MSKIALSGNASGTGTLTIAAPNTNSDATINLPTVTGGAFVVSDASGNVGIGTDSPTANTRLDVVSPSNNQQYVDVLRLKTSFNGDFHPSILFENNRNLVDNAAKIAIDSTSSAGSGVFIFQIKNSSGTFVNRMALLSDGNLQFNSGYGSVATAFGCRAWVNFNGTDTVAIRASGNVSSITDNGTGNYTVNFTTAMPDANYAATCFSAEGTGGPGSDRIGNIARGSANYLAGSVRVVCNDIDSPTTLRDQELVVVSIFR